MEKQLISAPVSVLKKFGYLSPNSYKNLPFKIGVISLFSFGFIISVLQNFYIKNEIFQIIDNSQMIFAVGQGLSKIILITLNRDKISNLIKLSDKFWYSDKCSKNTKKMIDPILSRVVVVQKLFLYSLLGICVLFTISMFTTDDKVPMGVWSMTEYTKLYKVVLPAYSSIIFVGSFFTYCFEGIFLGFCFELIVQFKILCDLLQTMNVESIESEQQLSSFHSQMKVYIEHHNFLCSFTKLFQDYYSTIFMVEYVTTSALICSNFYAVFESSNPTMILKFGFTCFLAISQFSFYCIPLATLSYEVTSVSTAIYNSNWYSRHYIKLKKSTLFMIQQAQREIRFTAWGLVDMNPQTLLQVLKVAFSVSAFLRRLD